MSGFLTHVHDWAVIGIAAGFLYGVWVALREAARRWGQ